MKTVVPILRGRVVALGVMTLAVALALPGCAGLAPHTPEREVEQKALQYWMARKDGDVGKAYALALPSFRQLRTQEQFKMQFGAGAAIASAEVTKVTCEPEKCMVRIKIGANPALKGLNVGTIETHMDEIWLLEDGQWWRHHDL